MSYFNMVCDSCGREVYGCNIVNGMKFCAKCYQETFGETDKDKQIAELQKQLKASEQLQDQKVIEVFQQFTEKCYSESHFNRKRKIIPRSQQKIKTSPDNTAR